MANLVLKRKHESPVNQWSSSLISALLVPASAASRSNLAWKSGWSHVISLEKSEVTILHFHFRPSNYWVVSTHLRLTKNVNLGTCWCMLQILGTQESPLILAVLTPNFHQAHAKTKDVQQLKRIPGTGPTYWLKNGPFEKLHDCFVLTYLFCAFLFWPQLAILEHQKKERWLQNSRIS